MIDLKGQKLNGLPVADLEWVRDLEYFDGPLISHFRHRQGDNYLYYWCDCDATVSRWMLLRVSETNIIRLANRFVPLEFVIPKSCQDDFVYFIDSGCSPPGVLLTRLEDIPAEYKPSQGTYLFTESLDPKSYSVLIEQNLSTKELTELPKLLSQVYAFLYDLIVLRMSDLSSYPWKGGFSSMHFYRWLLDQVPSESRPVVKTIQYASPGFIRLSLDGEIAADIGRLVDEYFAESKIKSAYYNLAGYIRKEKLNEMDYSDDSWDDHRSSLLDLTRNLLAELGLPNVKDLLDAPRPFEAAKISMSFVRRIRSLADLVRDGLIRLPRQPNKPKETLSS